MVLADPQGCQGGPGSRVEQVHPAGKGRGEIVGPVAGVGARREDAGAADEGVMDAEEAVDVAEDAAAEDAAADEETTDEETTDAEEMAEIRLDAPSGEPDIRIDDGEGGRQ